MATLRQIETGTIVGTVTDANGAVLPGVKVEIRSGAPGVTTTVTTNEAGRYQSPPLKPNNFTRFNNPNASIGSPQAGVVSSAGSPPSFQRTSRQIQIAAKLLF